MTAESPVLRAHVTFWWQPPSGAEGAEWIVSLYSTDAVALRTVSDRSAYAGLVTSIAWSPENQAIRHPSGYWSNRSALTDDDREHLALRATNALRHALGLAPHDATPNFPGTEHV